MGCSESSFNKPWRWFWCALKLGATALDKCMWWPMEHRIHWASMWTDVAEKYSSDREQKDTFGWSGHAGTLKGMAANPGLFKGHLIKSGFPHTTGTSYPCVAVSETCTWSPWGKCSRRAAGGPNAPQAASMPKPLRVYLLRSRSHVREPACEQQSR